MEKIRFPEVSSAQSPEMGGCGAARLQPGEFLGVASRRDTQCRHRTGAAQQSPAYLILGEQDQPGHQDIDNIAQTRVLEKFGNLTSKKQEKRSLKNELCGRASWGGLGTAGNRGWGLNTTFFGKQGWEWDSKPPPGIAEFPKPRSELAVSEQ